MIPRSDFQGGKVCDCQQLFVNLVVGFSPCRGKMKVRTTWRLAPWSLGRMETQCSGSDEARDNDLRRSPHLLAGNEYFG